MKRFVLALLPSMVIALPVAAQDRAPATNHEIIVSGKLAMPQNPQTVVITPAMAMGFDIESATLFEDASRRAAACATRGGPRRLAQLRDVVDGVFATPKQERAQDRMVWTTSTCGEGAAIRNHGVNMVGQVNVRADSSSYPGILYRGAFIIETIRAFAPDVSLTRQELDDPVVEQRFLLREDARASKRLPNDLRFFRTAICMVREQPQLAIKLVQTDPIEHSTAAIQAHLIERTRGCTGYQKQLTVDPFQFRAFVADALYRWILAARDVDTLIPAERASLDTPVTARRN